jgi:hypothetical protein
MANPSVVIDIAAEYTGKNAFDKAGKSTTGLEKSVKKLGKAFVGVFAAQKVLAFGKASVKAFAEDEKAAAALTQTLKNLGLGFANVGIEDFITKMSLSTGVADDVLRPAMQRLLQTNLDVAQSQKLMGLALDISAAGFGDVTSVAGDLSQAMVGNVKGIKKYNLGITQAELSTMTFAQIQERLTQAFKGQAAAAADTYAGKLNIIKNAAGEAQEAIGKSLIDALMDIGDNNDMQGLVDDILAAGEGIGYLISGIGDLIKKLGSIPGLGFEGVGKNAPMPFTLNPLAILAQQAYKENLSAIYRLETKRYENARKNQWLLSDPTPGKDSILTREEAIAGMTPSQKRKEMADKAAAAAAAKARADELKNIKKLAAAKALADKLAAAAKVKADKDAAANAAKLAKAGAMFDIDKIQIEAALKGKISDEEKLRLELQRAILNEDADLADKLQKKLEASQRATAALQGQINGIKPLADPFAAWLTTLEGIALTLAAIAKMPTSSVGGTAKINIPKTGEGAIEIITPVPPKTNNPDPIPVIVADPIPEPPATNNPFAGLGGNTGGFGFSVPSYLQNTIPQSQPAPVTVIVNNNGTTIMQDEFVKVVNEAVVTANTNGQNNYRPGAVPAENL